MDARSGKKVAARLWTSSLKRTQLTADYIQHPVVAEGTWEQMTPRVYRNLDEIFAGEYDGMTEAEIQNFDAFDAFDDADEKQGDQSKVHIRVQQRNGRKCITTVQGLADDLDVKRICKAFKKNFQCNGAVTKDSEMGEIIQLSGDQRTNVNSFLVDQEICLKSQVVIHGF